MDISRWRYHRQARHYCLCAPEGALRLDPTPVSRMLERVKILIDVRRFGEAEAIARKVVELNPQAIMSRRYLASALNAQGRYDEAMAEYMKDVDRGGFNQAPIGLGVAYARQGRRAEAERVIAERKKVLGGGGSNHYGIAAIQACLGEKDRAFEWLEQSYQEGKFQRKRKVANSFHPTGKWGTGRSTTDAPLIFLSHIFLSGGGLQGAGLTGR